MSPPNPEIEKFTIGGESSLWELKIRAPLMYQGLESTLEEKDLEDAASSIPDEKKKHI